jgi:AcrR family transcriptional regulator
MNGMSQASKAVKSPPPKSRGRPRSSDARAAILRAASELLDEGGLTAVTMEGIAARAGVGKPTIYRQWPNAHAVALSAFLESMPVEAHVRKSASAVADLKLQLRRIAALFGTRTGRAVAAMIAASQGETELSKAFRIHFIMKSRDQGHLLLKRAVAAKELRPDIDYEIVLDLIYAPIYFRLLIGHGPLDGHFTDSIVEHAVKGLGRVKARV